MNDASGPVSESPASANGALSASVALARRRRALLLLIAALLTLWTLWATVVLPSLPPLEGWRQIVRSITVRVALWIVPCSIYARSVGLKMTLLPWYFGLPPTARHWLVSIGTTLAAGIAVSFDVARKLALPPAAVWAMLLHAEPSVPIPEFFEELVFRGILLNELLAVLPSRSLPRNGLDSVMLLPSERSRFWWANLATSLVFMGLHWPWWIYTDGISAVFLMKSGGVFLISLVLGMLFVRSRSLWPCVALHWLNNALSSLAP
ncbi:MAG TPA: CPBP family intramembrane glutamic endopeptidase [Polyangiaceae bacterium]|nr:CPBP family intramembrane glutamic endopeptidase [Polyangiaceae bacterium]